MQGLSALRPFRHFMKMAVFVNKYVLYHKPRANSRRPAQRKEKLLAPPQKRGHSPTSARRFEGMRKELARQGHQVTITYLLDHRFKKSGGHHVKGWPIVVQHRYRPFPCVAQHLGRILLEGRHAD